MKKRTISAEGNETKTNLEIMGFNFREIPEGFLPLIIEVIGTLPASLQEMLPKKLRKNLPEDWYIKAVGGIMSYPVYFSREGKMLAQEDEMKKIWDILGRANWYENEGEKVYIVEILQASSGLKKGLNRLLGEHQITEFEGRKFIFCRDEVVSSFMSSQRWERRLLLADITLKINIGHNDKNSDAVWYIKCIQGNWQDVFAGSMKGEWQLLPAQGEIAEDYLSLQDVIGKIQKS